MKTIKKFCALVVCALASLPSMAQQTYQEMEQLTINENVTTVITATEPVRFVDISTDAVVGDQPINNTIRLKPKEGAAVHADGDILAIVTIVTERYRTQYALIYTTKMQEAVTDKQILASEKIPYHNPSVSMSTEDMTRYARKIWNSPARIRNVSTIAGVSSIIWALAALETFLSFSLIRISSMSKRILVRFSMLKSMKKYSPTE